MGLANIISPFLKPKWKHRHPETRKQAIAELEQDAQDIFTQISLEDRDVGVRCCAINRLTNLETLQQLTQEKDEQLSHCAEKRYLALLSGNEPESPELNQRLDRVHNTDEQRMLEHIAVHGLENELRLAALQHIQRDALLEDLALEDASAENRMAALERITQRSTLERVTRQSRSKYKQVYRRAREKLDAVIEEEERPLKLKQECENMVLELEKLHKRKLWLLEKALFEQLTQKWQTIESYASEELSQRYHHIREQIFQSLTEAEQQQLEDVKQQLEEPKKEILLALRNILDELDKNPPQEDAINALPDLQHQWESTSALAEPKESDYQKKYQRALSNIQQRIRTYKQAQQQEQQLGKLLTKAEKLLNTHSPITEKQIRQLKQQWEQIQPVPSTLLQTDSRRLESVLEQLDAIVARQKHDHQKHLDKFVTTLNALEQALTEGQLHEAQNLQKSADDLLKQVEAVAPKDADKFKNRYKRNLNRLLELKGWNTWANIQEREMLCEQAETLINSDADPQDLAQQVKTLRTQWKKLEGPSPDALWDRFNEACDKAFEPCKNHFETQAEERKSNLTKKQTLCDQLEQYLGSMDWSADNSHAIDWALVEQTLQQARVEWKGIGAVNRRDKKSVEDRFDQLMEQLYNKLKDYWSNNRAQKQQLLAKAKELVELAGQDIQHAVNETKNLQHQWKTIGNAGRYQEPKLWKQFRHYCDQVFELREQNFKEKQNELEHHLQEKQGVCEQIEALSGETTDIAKLQNGLQDLQAAWDNIGPVPKPQQTDINHRYEQACAAIIKQVKEQQWQQTLARLKQLQQKATVCEQLEALDMTDPSATSKLKELQTQWSELPALHDQLEKAITQRYQRALSGLTNGSLESLKEQNREILEQQALRLEILAEVESPPEAREARLSHQINLLENHLKTGELPKDKQQQTLDIIQQWHLCGPVDKEVKARLQPRVNNALEKLKKRQIISLGV